ncbi:protein of unknown function [Candidatus Methylacidiphilum fumarolicum]|uniref:Transposase n=1 Tax=Candidatus Methylacidiphilum fumarolicum TaxID=591154 RepID=A0ABM9IEB9_9BACT|nr:protein of unknown function [Candidatus Methylacidiphilum fumarolicum]
MRGGGKPSTCLPKLSQPSFRHQLNAMKREQFPCMLEVTKNASQMAIGQLGVACKNFWAGRAKYPKYRKTGGPDCFPLTRELGLADNAPIPKSTRLPATENAKKVIAKMSSLHACITNIRQDACRQFTSNLTRRFHSIVIKELNGRRILKSHPLARSIADGSVFEFWRQLEYKAEWCVGLMGVTDRWFASSNTSLAWWEGSEENTADCSPVDLPGLWKPPGLGGECDQQSPGVWLGSIGGSMASAVRCEVWGKESSGRRRHKKAV